MLYEKLCDLAQMLGEYHGHWNMGGGLTANNEAMAEIKRNYTETEIAEAEKMMYRQVEWNRI